MKTIHTIFSLKIRPNIILRSFDLFLRLFQQKHVRFVNKTLLSYRIHPENTLNEDRAMVHREKAIILADFLQMHNPRTLLPSLETPLAPVHLLSALQDPHIDRILLIFSHYSRHWQKLRDSLLHDPAHPLRSASLEYLRESIEQEEKLDQDGKKIQCLTETLERVKKENKLYRESVSFKIGRYCTWPIRKILEPNRKSFKLGKTGRTGHN